MDKRVLERFGGDQPGHWVGDGFPVRTLFSHAEHGARISPFLLLDYAGPREFAPTTRRRGVGRHPHRGFETVTIVYDGEVEHRDSAGHGGIIGPGDVQWMTAAGGIIHEEYHSPAFAAAGGRFQMVQLWVNLPGRDKMAASRYQALRDAEIPVIELADGAGSARIIAGEFAGRRGPAKTFTPVGVWDLRLRAGADLRLPIGEGDNAMLIVLSGGVEVGGSPIGEAQGLRLGREGDGVAIRASEATTLLALSGEPIDEPVVGYGPFVMNSESEIKTAIDDFNAGRFERVAA